MQPLNQQFKITNEDGTPSEYFIRWAQERQIDISSGLTQGVDLIAGTGLDGGGPLSSDVTIGLANTAVVPGFYANTNLTVDQQGRITSASNGSGGGGSSSFAMIGNNAVQDFAANVWTKLNMNTSIYSSIPGFSLAANTFVLPAGTYVIEGNALAIRSNITRLKLRDETLGTDILSGMASFGGAATGTGVGSFVSPSLFGVFTLAATTSLSVFQIIQATTASFVDNGYLGDFGTLGFGALTCQFKITKI